MTTTSAGTVTEAYEQLAATLRGDLITPSDPGTTRRAPALRGRAHVAVDLPM